MNGEQRSRMLSPLLLLSSSMKVKEKKTASVVEKMEVGGEEMLRAEWYSARALPGRSSVANLVTVSSLAARRVVVVSVGGVGVSSRRRANG